jgi:hypothetical protein
MSRSSGKLELTAFIVAIWALSWLTAHHHSGLKGLVETLLLQPMQGPLFITPCIVYGLTISAYYRFVTEYRGHVAGFSLINSLVALALCVMLVESREWWDHLRLIYALFFSYVVWDILMGYYLKRLQDDMGFVPSDVSLDIAETRTISTLINQPTLFTVFLVWLYATFIQSRGQSTGLLESYISGVVSFHLAFSSVAYLATRYYFKHGAVATTHSSPTVEESDQMYPVASSGDGLRLDAANPERFPRN